MTRKHLLASSLAICTFLGIAFLGTTDPAAAQTSESAEPTARDGDSSQAETPARERRGRLGQDRAERDGGMRARWQRRDRQLLGMIPLLQMESVQREIATSEDDTSKIETLTIQIREDFSDEIREIMQTLRDSDPEQRQNLRGRMAEVRERVNERLAASLSGDQMERLRQIDLQLGLRRSGAIALTSDEIAEALDLTSEQQQQLRRQARERRQQAAEQVSTTLDSAREQVSDILTSAQQEKLDTLLGPEFDLPEALLESGPRQRGLLRQRAPAAPPIDDELAL